MHANPRFARFAWIALGVNVLVAVWGALVRASGSGAGCGSHWPACNGAAIPRLTELETAIEFTHRLSSGAALLLVLALLVWSRRAFAAGHPARSAAVAATLLILVEAGIGAGLVLAGLVADNPSLLRAPVMAAHLANTFLLLGALALTAWWGSGAPAMRLRGGGSAGALLAAALGGLLLVGVSGAIAALGDTLFPARSLAEGFRQDADPAAHLLLRLRVLHPLLAVAAGGLAAATALLLRRRSTDPRTRRLGALVAALVALQLVAGLVNLVLLAPVPMQLLHLLLADGLWIALVLLAASSLAATPARPASVRPAAPRPAAVAR